MPFNRKSRIRDVWQNPAGHDLLLLYCSEAGKPMDWPEKPFVANMRLGSLEKTAGREFVDLLLEETNSAEAALMAEALQATAAEVGAGTKPAWWKQAVGYRVYLPSFMDSDHDGVGDLGGVLQRLPYLETLGADLLWLSPLQEVPAEGLPDYTAVQPDYGDKHSMETLLEAAHMRGMRVVLELDAAGTAATSLPPAEVMENLQSALRFWRGLGVDGFCISNLHLLGKTWLEGRVCPPNMGGGRLLRRYLCGPPLHARVQALRRALAPLGPVFLAGALPLASPGMARLFQAPGRGELDLLLQTGPLAKNPASLENAKRLDLVEVKARYLKWVGAADAEYWTPLLIQTADMPRAVSRVSASGVYRATLAKMLATMLLTLRGTPLVYQGDELGIGNTRFEGLDELQDEAAKALYTELRGKLGDKPAFDLVQAHSPMQARTPFPWSAGPGGGFTGAAPWLRLPDGAQHLNAAQQMGDRTSVWMHYQALIALRRQNPCLVYGSVKPAFVRNKRVFCYFRVLEGEKWYVEMNLTATETARPGRIAKNMRLAASNYTQPARGLRPFEANLYKCE